LHERSGSLLSGIPDANGRVICGRERRAKSLSKSLKPKAVSAIAKPTTDSIRSQRWLPTREGRVARAGAAVFRAI